MTVPQMEVAFKCLSIRMIAALEHIERGVRKQGRGTYRAAKVGSWVMAVIKVAGAL